MSKFDKFFKISERGSTIQKEIIAGITTFFAMAYIIFVNPNQVAAEGANGWLAGLGADAALLGQIWNSVYIASILVAIIGTMLMALYARLPFAQACGMGLNAFFCTMFVSGYHFAGKSVLDGYQAGLVIIFVSGLVFLLLSVTGARQYIAKALPDCLKKSISAGIGLFIAYIGFQNVGIIQANQYTISQFFDFHGALTSAEAFGDKMAAIAAPLVALLGFIIIAVLTKKNVKGAVILGILASTVLYYVFTWTLPQINMSEVFTPFKDFGEIGVTAIFKPESWKNAFGGDILNAIILVVTFCLVDMFDTIGTLYGTASQADMLDENGDPIDVDKAMLCDSIGTCAGAVLGTSTCTTFVESASGVAAGGRTGFTSVITSACFLIALFLSPIASIIPSAATAPALIFVGVLMLKNFSAVDMDDISSAVPAFLTLIMMPLTYSIANGIGIGAIAYVLIKLLTGKYSKKDIMVTLIAILFILKFALVTM